MDKSLAIITNFTSYLTPFQFCEVMSRPEIFILFFASKNLQNANSSDSGFVPWEGAGGSLQTAFHSRRNASGNGSNFTNRDQLCVGGKIGGDLIGGNISAALNPRYAYFET